MASRLLFKGKQTSYDDLVHELNPDEQLVATYLDNVRNPRVRLVPNEAVYDDVIKRSYDHTEPEDMTGWEYYKLCWFASTNGSINPSDYGMTWE